jgi:hypothetical protein
MLNNQTRTKKSFTILSPFKFYRYNTFYPFLIQRNNFEAHNHWLIIYGFTSCSRIFHLCGDVTIASEELQNLGLCSALRAFEQGGIFIVPHVLWHGTSVFLVSSDVGCLRFYVLLKNSSLSRRHHCRWRAVKFRPMLGAQGSSIRALDGGVNWVHFLCKWGQPLDSRLVGSR